MQERLKTAILIILEWSLETLLQLSVMKGEIFCYFFFTHLYLCWNSLNVCVLSGICLWDGPLETAWVRAGMDGFQFVKVKLTRIVYWMLVISCHVKSHFFCFFAVAVCDEPTKTNAIRKGPTEPPYRYRSVIQYRCQMGMLDGPRQIYCTSDGTWNASPPQCKGLGTNLSLSNIFTA